MSLVNPSGGSCRRTDSLLATGLLCPGTPHSRAGCAAAARASPSPARLADRVSDALSPLPAPASGLSPLRHRGNTLAPTPAGDYAPRASHFPGAQRGMLSADSAFRGIFCVIISLCHKIDRSMHCRLARRKPASIARGT